MAAFPALSRADVTTFGSRLAVPATIDTATGLNYAGTDVHFGAGVIHVAHDGADTPLWNVNLASGDPAAPAAGQVLLIKLEGCAQPAGGIPLVDVHFQDLKQAGGGAVTVSFTSGTFQVPVCGQNGANGATVSAYAPADFCVTAGDYVDFNDEGGFDPNLYPSGVPFQVIAAAPGSTMDSFIRTTATSGNTFSPTDTSNHDGFAVNRDRELLLQSQLATGADASPRCGGTRGIRPPTAGGARPAVVIHSQRDGVTRKRLVKVGYFCSGATPCIGTVTLSRSGTVLGRTTVNSPGHRSAQALVRLTAAALDVIRGHHRRIAATMTITLADGRTVARTITLMI